MTSVNNQLATKEDLDKLEVKMRDEIGALRREIRGDIDSLSTKIDEKHNQVMNMLDTAIGEYRAFDEEKSVRADDHGRLLTVEDEVEKLKNLHPGDKHVSCP